VSWDVSHFFEQDIILPQIEQSLVCSYLVIPISFLLQHHLQKKRKVSRRSLVNQSLPSEFSTQWHQYPRRELEP
jgi:hypothetical protein